MRKYLLITLMSGFAAAAVAAGLNLRSNASTSSSSEPVETVSAPPQPEKPSSSSTTLPLTHVHLFTNGVGYFQRQGVVEGNARIDLTFPVNNVNDLIKSMILEDLDGGRISVVGYDSFDPADKT